MSKVEKNTTPAVDQMSEIRLTGNCIPPIWYKTINYRNKRGIYPHLLAINLLADLCYWYSPTVERDEITGQIISIRKKFKGDKLQRSYDQIMSFFGCSKEQAKDAVSMLEFRGLATKEFRTVIGPNGPMPNVMFLEPVVSEVVRYSSADINMDEFTDMGGVGEFTDTYKCINRYVRVNSLAHLRELMDTNTNTTTDSTTKNTQKEDQSAKADSLPTDQKKEKEAPKSRKKSQRKKVAAKKESPKLPAKKEPTLHSKARERFDEWYERFAPGKPPIYWDAKENGSLKNMLNRLKDAASKKGVKWDDDDQFLSKVFDVFCAAFIKSDQWYSDCFVPSSIVSKWNIIIQTLHDGRNKQARQSQRVTDAYKRNAIAELDA